jgi:hypothetical protein
VARPFISGVAADDAFLNDFANGVEPVRLITHPGEATQPIMNAVQAVREQLVRSERRPAG